MRFEIIGKTILLILFLGLIGVNILFLQFIDQIKGDSKIVNYSGLIRGMTQKFVIQEFALNYDNITEKKIDDIITQLKTGKGIDNLKVLRDLEFVEILDKVENSWLIFKKEIQNYRRTKNPEMIFKISQDFFDLSNKLVFRANKLAEEKLKFLSDLRIIVLIIYIFLTLIFFYQILSFISLKKDKQILNEKATIDQMSGLANRWSCDLKSQYYMEMENLPDLLCVSIDLNDLKKINDTLGHSYGDDLIITFSKILNDVFSPFGFIGRSGGDEFVGYFENFTKEKEVELAKLLEKSVINHNLSKPWFTISYSYGSALSSDFVGLNSDSLMQIADENMYKNKKNLKLQTDLLKSAL